MLRDLESIGDTHLMAASVHLTHLLLTPITLTPQMIRRRVGIATVDESVWASLFTSAADRTYLDTSTVLPQWSVTLASTRRDGSPIERSSDVCDASVPAVTPIQTAPRDRPKKDAKRPRQGDHQDTHRARPPAVGPLKRGGGGLAAGPMAASAPCPVAQRLCRSSQAASHGILGSAEPSKLKLLGATLK